jgi:hypothetical protein
MLINDKSEQANLCCNQIRFEREPGMGWRVRVLVFLQQPDARLWEYYQVFLTASTMKQR